MTRDEYDSPVPQVQTLSAPSPLRGELIAAFNALIRRIEKLEAAPPACTCGQGNVWGYPYGSGHSQGCPYRLAMAQADAKRKATS